MYAYKSRAGTFTIGIDAADPNGYELCIGGMWLGSYETAEKAAAAVCLRCTGWHDWDRLKDPEAPRDLSDWESLE